MILFFNLLSDVVVTPLAANTSLNLLELEPKSFVLSTKGTTLVVIKTSAFPPSFRTAKGVIALLGSPDLNTCRLH